MWEFEEKGIPVHQLKVGMYVSRLDIPWSNTNYPLQGILIQSQKDIERLSLYCQQVFIDVAKSRGAQEPLVQLLPKRAAEKPGPAATKKARPPSWRKRHCVENYKTTTPLKKELERSAEIFDTLERQVYLLCEHTFRCRRANLEELVESTSQIVESIIRNPDAFAWLCRIRDSRKPIYMHIIRLAVWGGIVGRQLGLNRFSLTHLCFALLMTGIGKSRIGDAALESFRPGKPSEAYQKHLHETLYQLKEIRFSNESVVDTLADYCERIDGSGYPAGKQGNEIPFLSQICGLIETFELLINPYDASRAVSPANAIVYLNRCKGVVFEESLVEAFIKAIGIYPTGTLVELNNGTLGVIHSQNYEKRLRASVIPILSEHGNIIDKLEVMDLSYSSESGSGGDNVYIRRGVPSNNIPRGLLERAHQWMYLRQTGVKGFFQRRR